MQYIHGILFSLKKGGNSGPCYNMMDIEDIMLSDINQAEKGKCHIFISGCLSSQIHRGRK
jgi:hypothetical protein